MTIFAVALSVAPQLVSTSIAAGTYSATLISPRAGQVLYPGQKIMVEWNSTLPNIDLTGCEREVWLSLDGGRTFMTCITPIQSQRGRNIFCHVDFARAAQRALPWAKNHAVVKSTLPNIDLYGVREGSLAVAGRRENFHDVHYANTAPKG